MYLIFQDYGHNKTFDHFQGLHVHLYSKEFCLHILKILCKVFTFCHAHWTSTFLSFIHCIFSLSVNALTNKSLWTRIMEQCKQNLAEYSHPHETRFCDSLPITSLGKVDFKVLETKNRSIQQNFFILVYRLFSVK